MTDLEIRLLGGLHIGYGDAPAPHFVSSKAPALLAYLAVTGRPHQRDALAGLLWGELPDAAAANNLRQALSNLRKLFEPYLQVTRDTVAFDRTLQTHSLLTWLPNPSGVRESVAGSPIRGGFNGIGLTIPHSRL